MPLAVTSSRIGEAIAAAGCSGCEPEPAKEAYAFLWAGSMQLPNREPTTGFPAATLSGLRAAVASIRVFDRSRDIVVLVLDPLAASFAPLVELRVSFAPLHIVLQPRLDGWDLLKNFYCRMIAHDLIHKVDRALNASSAGEPGDAVRTSLVEWETRYHWPRRNKTARAARWAAFEAVGVPRLRAFAERLQRDGSGHALFEAYNSVGRPLQQFATFNKFRVFSLWNALTRAESEGESAVAGRGAGGVGLRKSWSRVLYLDTDVLVARPLEPLWQIRFSPHQAIAAVPTLENHQWVGAEPSCESWARRGQRSRKSPGSRGSGKSASAGGAADLRRHQLNSGVYMLRPSRSLEEALLTVLKTPMTHEQCGMHIQTPAVPWPLHSLPLSSRASLSCPSVPSRAPAVCQSDAALSGGAPAAVMVLP